MIGLFLFDYRVEAFTPPDNVILTFSIYSPAFQCLVSFLLLPGTFTNTYFILPHSCFAEETSLSHLEEKIIGIVEIQLV